MKKIIYFTLIAFFIMAGASFAGTWTVTSSNGGTISHHASSIQDTRASKNVTIVVVASAQSYAASAGHKSGDKAYGVSSDSTLVKYTTKTKGTDWSTSLAPTGSDSGAFNSWDSM